MEEGQEDCKVVRSGSFLWECVPLVMTEAAATNRTNMTAQTELNKDNNNKHAEVGGGKTTRSQPQQGTAAN